MRSNSCKFIEGLVLDGGLPALQGGTLLKLQDFLHDVLPIPFGHLWIDGHQVGAGDLQVNGRLLVRLVLGVKNALGGDFVPGWQAGLFAGERSSMKKMPVLRWNRQ